MILASEVEAIRRGVSWSSESVAAGRRKETGVEVGVMIVASFARPGSDVRREGVARDEAAFEGPEMDRAKTGDGRATTGDEAIPWLKPFSDLSEEFKGDEGHLPNQAS